MKKNKLIVFTESKETAEYLTEELKNKLTNDQSATVSPQAGVIAFTGASSIATREKVIENFDARVRLPKDDYRILITTEVLSEGVNLHRSNVVINYDIPWNPTRLIQRVGRINRVDTSFDTIYSFNFFPTEKSNDQIKLKEAFAFATTEEAELKNPRGGQDASIQVLKILKAIRDFRQYTDDHEAYLKRVMNRLEEGALPKQTAKTVLTALNQEINSSPPRPLKILDILQNNIPKEFLESHIAESDARTSGPREVILSAYLISK